MVDVDEFESQFRASVKERPLFQRPDVRTVLLMTDLAPEPAATLERRARAFLSVLGEEAQWSTIVQGDVDGVRGMLEHIERVQPDLIVAYRHLYEPDKDLPHSLGTYADMLTQALTTPVLLLPNPLRSDIEPKLFGTQRVVVMTDHIVGDQRLVNWGLRFVDAGGQLFLVQVEDDLVFRRYIEVISKIPDIDTEVAEQTIGERLTHEAEDFLDAWAQSIHTDFSHIAVETHVRRGHTTRDYMAIAREAKADLLVFNTREMGQLAMQGIAYALAVELLDVPLLML